MAFSCEVWRFGIGCASMKEGRSGALEDKLRTAFTLIMSMGRLQAYQCVTGQRQLWLLRLEIPKPEDFNRPGHVLPLKYRDGCVLKRAWHTEASVDLAVFATLWQFSL